MRFLPILALVLGLFACSGPIVAEDVTLETEDQKILYAVGQAIAQSIAALEFSDEELTFVMDGIRDGAKGAEPKIDMAAYAAKLQSAMQARAGELVVKEKERGKTYCAAMAEEEGAETLESGLVFRGLSEGSGESPTSTDTVKVHYHGTLRDGTVFDSTQGRDPVSFNVSGVIPCFSEALMKLKPGGKAKVTCPSDIAYGDRGSPPKIRPGAALTFEMELVEVVDQAAATGSTPIP